MMMMIVMMVVILSRNDINSKGGWGDSNRGNGHDLGRLVGQRLVLRHAHVDEGRVMTALRGGFQASYYF
jgi:hypothetical protein